MPPVAAGPVPVTAPEPGTRTWSRGRARPGRLAAPVLGAAVALAALLPLAPPSGASPAAPSAATGSCREVGGGVAAGPGPNRATVLVDTGSGDVWSACVSFSGTISGIDAVELATAVIPDLDPVYDLYAGEGFAICRLRGIGNDPPDCLGKSVDYWGYYRNGRYAASGAGRTEVGDGDVEAWKWGRDARVPPRAATRGTEAAAAAPPATTTTTRPAPTTTRPPSGGLGATPGAPGTPDAPGGPGATTTVPGATTTTRPGATTTTLAGTTTTSAAGEDGEPTTTTPGAADGGPTGSGDDERAVGAGPAEVADGRGSSSTAGSVAGFGVVLVVVVGAGLVLRRRRAAAA